MIETIEYTVTIPNLDNCKEYIDGVADNLIRQAEISARDAAVISEREKAELQSRIDETVSKYSVDIAIDQLKSDITEALDASDLPFKEIRINSKDFYEALDNGLTEALRQGNSSEYPEEMLANIPKGKKLSGAVAEGKKKRAYNRSKTAEVAKKLNGND